MFLPNMNFLHLMVSEIWPRQDFSRSRSLWQGQIKVTLWCCTPILANQCPYQVSNSWTLQFPRYGPDKIFPLPARLPKRPYARLHSRIPWIKTIPKIDIARKFECNHCITFCVLTLKSWFLKVIYGLKISIGRGSAGIKRCCLTYTENLNESCAFVFV